MVWGDSMNKLKKVRIENNLTYQEMAIKLGLCKSYYWQLENKKRNLSYSMAVKIAKIFNLKPDDLFYDEFKSKNN